MFAFFVNGEFKGIWGNKVGDIFYNNTIEKLEWDITQTKLVWYEVKKSEMKSAFAHEFYETHLLLRNELGEIIKEIPSELFAENGLLHKAC